MFRRIFSTIARRVASSRLLIALIIVLQVLYLLPVLKQTTMGGWQDSIASTEVESIRMYRSSQSLDLNGYPEDDAVGSWHRANDIKMAQAADKLLDRWDAGDANGYFAAAAEYYQMSAKVQGYAGSVTTSIARRFTRLWQTPAQRRPMRCPAMRRHSCTPPWVARASSCFPAALSPLSTRRKVTASIGITARSSCSFGRCRC